MDCVLVKKEKIVTEYLDCGEGNDFKIVDVIDKSHGAPYTVGIVEMGKCEGVEFEYDDDARGVCCGTTEKGLVSDGTPRGCFYRKQLLFSFKKRNKQSTYGTGMAGNKVKCDGGHTTVNVWI